MMIALLFGLSGTAWTIIIIIILALCGVVVITDDTDWFD